MSPHDDPAVLAVCGWSGSGKTTLLERAIAVLVADGLHVAVVKHDVHGVRVDPRGKDSARLFRAGADVVLTGPGEVLERRRSGAGDGLAAVLRSAAARCDLVLVEGHKDTPLPKVWLATPERPEPPPGLDGLLAVLPRDAARTGTLVTLARALVARAWAARPVLGGLLVGGSGTRMGRAKHLVRAGGRTLAETASEALAAHCRRVVLLGGGAAPPRLRELLRLPDAPGVEGPLGGVLAAFRWAPQACWVLLATDLPGIDAGSVGWLLARRRPGVWGVVPRGAGGHPEALAAVYEPPAAPLFEALALEGRRAVRGVAAHPAVTTVEPPPSVAARLESVNTPAELARWRRLHR